MPRAVIDGVGIEYEAVGEGFPLVWCHEGVGHKESWWPQVHFFARHYRVITFDARGYPPSDVPKDLEAYSPDRFVEDVAGLLRHLGHDQAYVGGQSLGANTAMHFGIAHPEMARAIIIAAGGAGPPELTALLARADDIEADGSAFLRHYANSANREQLRRKDPVAWQEFEDKLVTHSPEGMIRILRGLLARYPTGEALAERLRQMDVPTLILVGDEDDNALEAALILKRTIPRSGLVTFAQSGHSLNLEESVRFNQAVFDFLKAVEAGEWVRRGRKPAF
jgi:pimeloyl-ACP methyl ester carboxylesterase